MNNEEMLTKMRDSEMFYLDMIRVTKEHLDNKNWSRVVDVLAMLIRLDGKNIVDYVNSSATMISTYSTSTNNTAKVLTPSGDYCFDESNDTPKVDVSASNEYSISPRELDDFILDCLWEKQTHFANYSYINEEIEKKFGSEFNSHDLKKVKGKENTCFWETRTFDRAAELKKKNLIFTRKKGTYQLTAEYIKSRTKKEQEKNAQTSLKF